MTIWEGYIVWSRVEAESGTMNVRVDGGDGDSGKCEDDEGEMEDDAGDHLPKMVTVVRTL